MGHANGKESHDKEILLSLLGLADEKHTLTCKMEKYTY